MSLAVAEDPCIRHLLPGRVRVYVPGWAGKGKRTIETGLRLIEGVQRVQANPLTGTVLIEYDPTLTDVQLILHEVHALDLEKINALDKDPPPPPVQTEKRGRIVRARIAVRGLDHDPQLAKLVVERLACRPGVVQVKVNWLTGRVLVEFFEHKEDLDDLLAEVIGLEMPARPEEDRPSHPLDPGPWLQSTLRTIGASLGLGLEEDNHLPARADLLAPDLDAVATIIEAGARRDAAVRDSVGLSTLSNLIGVIWGWQGLPGIEVAVSVVYLTALGALADAWFRLRGGKRLGS